MPIHTSRSRRNGTAQGWVSHSRSISPRGKQRITDWVLEPIAQLKGKNKMKTVTAVLLLALTLSHLGFAEETAFNGVKLADAKGKQADARLIFSDDNKNVVVRVADRDFVTIPYDQIDKFSYEYTKKHRVTQGAIVMLASVGAGAIVMLTKSKSHWLYIDFREQSTPKTVVLRMDKNEYRKIFDAVKRHTGKEVEFLGDAKDKQKKKEKSKRTAEFGGPRTFE